MGENQYLQNFRIFWGKIFFFLGTIMKKGFLFVLLVCFYHVDGGVMTNYDPNKTEEKQEKIGLMSNFQLKLKGTEKRNGGTITKFEVKLKDSGDDGKEPNFQLSLKDNENENENIEWVPYTVNYRELLAWKRKHCKCRLKHNKSLYLHSIFFLLTCGI